jgi:hypothetical protein
MRTSRLAGRNASTSALVCAILLAGMVRNAHGHTILITRGEAVIHEDHLAMRLEVSAEDFLHDPTFALDPDRHMDDAFVRQAAIRHRESLRRRVTLRDVGGRPIPASAVSLEWSPPPGRLFSMDEFRRLRLHYKLVFPFDIRPDFLTFQLVDSAGTQTALSQLALLVSGEHQPTGRTLRLTSRGNAETVEVLWQDDRAQIALDTVQHPASDRAADTEICVPFEQRGSHRFDEVFAEMHRHSEKVLVTVHVPLPILDTWFRFNREHPGAITSGEQHAAAVPVSQLLQRSISVSVGDKVIAPAELNLRFTPITMRGTAESGPLPADDTADESIGFFTGRLVAVLLFPISVSSDEATLTWNLFNPGVLTAAANVTVDGRCRQHDFTTFEPTLVLR